jgi:chemotaxis methyl-accepting protein methylase
VWKRLPANVRDHRPVRTYGEWLHRLVNRQARREMYLGTYFLRNRPALELMSRLIEAPNPADPAKITVLGCSIGVEVYSIVWMLRRSRPELAISIHATDISADAVRIGEQGVYGQEALMLANWPVFDSLSEAERAEMFDWDQDVARIKPWLQEGLKWHVGDASDPNLATQLGAQDFVVANNFLCHMAAPDAESCLRNLARTVRAGGHLLVTGVDLDVRTRVALDLGWEPVPDRRAEIHDGDPAVRGDWPWRWWGLEPLDARRPDWETRYSAVFRIPQPR